MTATTVLKELTGKLEAASARLARFGTPLGRLLAFSPADDLLYPFRSVNIAIEKAGFSMAYGVRVLGKPKIKGLARHSFPEEGMPLPESLATSASLTLGRHRAAKAAITLTIPKEWAVIGVSEFPSAVKENLANVVSYELDRITPFSAEEAYYDYAILTETDDRLKVLVMAARIETVRPYLDALAEKGVKVSRLSVDLSGMGALCRYVMREPDNLFLEFSDTSYKGAAYRDGHLLTSFTEDLLISDERQQIERIVSDVGSLAEALGKDRTQVPLMVLFRGSTPSLKEMLRVSLGPSAMVLGETDLKIDIPAAYGKELSYKALGSLVESLWPPARRYSLLSKGVHQVRKTPKALTIVLLVAILGLLSLYAVAPVWVEGKKLQDIDRQIALRKDDVRKVEALKKEIDAAKAEIGLIESFKEGRPLTLNLLRELTTVLPKTAWLTRARITETGAEIEGYASSATELLPKLESSKYFQKVEFASPTFRDVRMNSDRFIIKMEIEGVRKHEPDKTKGDKAKSEKK